MSKDSKSQQVALITGCSRGIGYATVELLALHNFKIYACVRSVKTCKSLCLLSDKNPNIIVREIDLKKKSSIKKLTSEIKKKEEVIDIIVNNASSIVFGPIETISSEQFHEQFQVNLFGPILLTQELIPLMRQQKRGHIIFLGSTSGIESHGMYGAYAASKFALEAICHSLAVNLYPWNIHVSIIELSATATLIAKKTLKMGSRMRSAENPYLTYANNTLKYLRTLLINGSQPKEIANAILGVIVNPPSELRCFATERSKKTFEGSLKDPANIKWKEEAKDSTNFYSEGACLYNNH
jgi:NAD(P)-dependent dehydrogenase (short-subunit alcohol dehydrogenase family)